MFKLGIVHIYMDLRNETPDDIKRQLKRLQKVKISYFCFYVTMMIIKCFSLVESIDHQLNNTYGLALGWMIYRFVAAIICLSSHCYLLKIGHNI